MKREYKIRTADKLHSFSTQDAALRFVEVYHNKFGFGAMGKWEFNFSPEYDDTPMPPSEFKHSAYGISEDYFEPLDI